MSAVHDTGKVQIGKHYAPPQVIEAGSDMEYLQSLLLKRRQHPPIRSVLIYACLLSSVGVLFLLL